MLLWLIYCKAELSHIKPQLNIVCSSFDFKDMDIDEGQDGVEEEIFEQEAKKVAVRSRSRTHSRSRSRFCNNV